MTLRIREFTPLSEATHVQEQLLSLDVVKSVTLNEFQGNSLNLVVEAEADVLTQIESKLNALNLPLFGISRSQPSLEDVYLAVTGKCVSESLN